jgi:tetratricopeptide (TPR) repeat protein
LNKKTVIYVVVSVALGFVAGFALANGINRQEQDKLRAELTRLRAGSPPGAGASGDARGAQPEADTALPTLTDAQLGNAIAQADAAPADLTLQRKAGQALYLYAMEKGNVSILPEVARILKRAHELDPRDYNTTVLAANAHFLIARQPEGDPRLLAEARRLYESALAAQPDDVVVRTTLGLTYFYDRPPDVRRAIREYRRALESSPRHEMALQSLAAALIEAGDFAEAERRLGELEGVNASNPELPNLRAQFEQKRNAAKERE